MQRKCVAARRSGPRVLVSGLFPSSATEMNENTVAKIRWKRRGATMQDAAQPKALADQPLQRTVSDLHWAQSGFVRCTTVRCT